MLQSLGINPSALSAVRAEETSVFPEVTDRSREGRFDRQRTRQRGVRCLSA